MPNLSWPGFARFSNIPFLGPDISENENENENAPRPELEEEGESQVFSLCIDEDAKVHKGIWDVRLFDIGNVNIHSPALGWECVHAVQNRVDGNGAGRIKFFFPISLLSQSSNFLDVHDIVACVD